MIKKSTKSNLKQRGEGTAETVAGVIQEALGHVLGDEVMQARGAAHQAVVHARDEAARKEEHAAGVVDEAVGSAKSASGELLGNKKLKTKGKLQELSGKVRQLLND